MSHRKLVMIAVLLAAPVAPVAHADVALGGFLGEPTGIDLKIGMRQHSALDILVGNTDLHNFGNNFSNELYGHLTYLVTPVVGHGQSVLVPLRLGIGLALFDDYNGVDDRLGAGVRFPIELALRFRSAPLEIYGELALLLVLVDPPNRYDFANVQGGVGIRFYF